MHNWLRKSAQIIGLFCWLTTVAWAQGRRISGKVIDAKGNAVVGASALIKGTTTDATGAFTIGNLTNTQRERHLCDAAHYAPCVFPDGKL